jgi:transcriptional regulator
MSDSSLQLVRGTLDLLVLKALSWGPRHGYAVSQWIKGVTEGALLVEEGSLYPALQRIQRKGWIRSRWGVSDTGRRARFYELTPVGEERR